MRDWIGLLAAIGLATATVAGAETPTAPSSPAGPPGANPSAATAAPPRVAPLPPDMVVVKVGGEAQPGAGARPFGFTHVVMRLPDGAQWINQRGGIFCIPNGTRTWTSGQVQEPIATYATALRPAMKDAGFTVDGDPDNVFAPAASTADLELAAVITDLRLDYCAQLAGYGNTTVAGSATMQVEWQVYSTIQKAIVAKITTNADTKVDQSMHATINTLMMNAFKENVAQLIASADFRKAVSAPPTDTAGIAKPQAQSPLVLSGALAAKPRPVSEAVNSVVMIFAGETQGSGFLVSSDGLLLTDEHVVGEAKYVKVRWADGVEGLGEVVRADKVRDVALVKADAHGRQPIRIRRDAMQPGDTVFAIGAPFDPKFQNTVTRGVVSANRTFEGVTYIQSDVSVNPGSSGGPLLDDKGDAVGLTESGVQPAGAPSGINLFVPIGDALDFLSAQPQ